MDINTLKQKSDELIAAIKEKNTQYSQCTAAFIADSSNNIYLGLSSLVLKGGALTEVLAENEAVRNMKVAGGKSAAAMIVVNMKTGEIVKPSIEALNQLFAVNPKNDKCSVMLEGGSSETVMNLRLGDTSNLMDGFDFDAADDKAAETKAAPEEPAVSAPAAEQEEKPEVSANVITGVNIDESNPFYEAPDDVKPPEDVIADGDDENGLKDSDIPDPELTPEQLLAQAKKRKKVARSNFLFRRRK